MSKKMPKKHTIGLHDTIAGESSICYIDGKKGILLYRGYTIEDLALHCSFEEIIYLLWYGKLPTPKEGDEFKKELEKYNDLPTEIVGFIKQMPKSSIMASVRSCISLLSQFDPKAEEISEDANSKKAIKIMALMPGLIPAIYRTYKQENIIFPIKGKSIAWNFLYCLHDKEPSEKDEKTFNACLVLHAEHEFNASTFAARVTGSTLADLYSGVVSALSTLKGPLHGAANKRAVQALHTLGEKVQVTNICDASCRGKVDKYVEESLERKERIMGIGHRVYKVKDPRAIILEKYASTVNKRTYVYYEIAKEIEKEMGEKRGLYPNVDFFSGLVYEDLGIPYDLYVSIFALSRTSGWIAHMMEQYANNKLIRPISKYTGEKKRKFLTHMERE